MVIFLNRPVDLLTRIQARLTIANNFYTYLVVFSGVRKYIGFTLGASEMG